jgi:type IV pilus assembly protein PilV
MIMVQNNPTTSGVRKTRQRGASMIELLVSLLIFAFGMLGLVGLQNRTLSFGQMSLYRSQATALTDDILDRMRADRANAKLGNWNSADTVASATVGTATLAERDLKDWKSQVETLLPEGKASIAVAAGVVTVIIRWNERDTAANTNFTTVSGL